MQRDDDPVAGAKAAGPSTISDVLATLQLSDDSEAQVTSFVDSLAQGLSGPRFRKLLTYILKLVELNRSKYETLRSEQARFIDLATSNRDELNQILTVLQERLPPVAPVPRVPAVPAVATQPFQAPLPAVPAMATQPSQATLPNIPAVAPQVSQSTEPPAPMAPASAPVQPSAFQAVPPPSAPQAAGMGYFAAPATFTPSIPNQDGTVSRRMDQVGNNVIVTFSGDDEMASKKAKLFRSSAKYDIFTGQDMSKFPEWVAQFLSGVNLFQPTEPNACRIALHLLRDKAAEMSKNVSQQVTMRNLQELLTTLDRIFNTSGNRIVAVGLFNSFTQREDMPVQDYAIRIEQLFYRAYPGMNPDLSIFLMDRFINGLISTDVKQRLRIPPQPSYLREAVEKAMSLTAAIYHGDQIMKQRSMAWKMAASASNPLNTKSSKNPRGHIQMIETPEDTPATVQVIRKWCTLHKTDKHSNADCRAQKETAPSSTATATASKKCPKGSEKRKAKSRKLRFKSTSDKKKFLRSIEDTEGVSLESASSDDEDVVEQSLMQLDPVSGGTTDEEEEGELHILMLDPDSLLDDPDINMDSVFLDPSASTEALDSGVSGIRLEGEKADSPMSMKAGCSSSGFSPLDTALLNTAMNTPVAPVPTVKDEKNPFSPEQYPNVEEDMFPPLASNIINPEASAVESLPNQNYLLFGVYYQPVPPPHNVVVTHSTVPRPDLVPAPLGPLLNVHLPVAASEIPLPATATDTETNGSDLSVPLVEVAPTSAAIADTAAKTPANPDPKEDKEFAVPKEPSSSGSTKTHRKARPRSRSSSSPNSEPSQAPRPQGVSPSDSLTNAKRVRGIGRGKAKEAANVMPMPSSNLLTGAVALENIRITVPTGGGSRKIEIVPDYPANIGHLAKLEDETRGQEEVQLSSAMKTNFTVQLPPSDSLTNAKQVRGVGRGKAKEAANVMPMPSSNLLTGAVALENIRITVPTGGGSRKIEIVPDYPANIGHLAKLEDETRGQEEVQLSSAMKTNFTVQLPREDPQEDSEIDILTGEIKNPKTVPMQFSFQANLVLEDHQRFAQEVLKLEPDSWDRTKVESNPCLFYHAYFLD